MKRQHLRCRTLRLGIEMLEQRALMAADLVGAIRNSNAYLLNLDADAAPEVDLNYGLAGDVHFAADWAGRGSDQPGVARRGAADGLLRWHLDTNGDPAAELMLAFGFNTDKPVAGNWDGLGGDNVGVVRPSADGLLRWYLDTDGDPMPELERGFGLNGDTPVVGDWNGDGRDDQGVVRIGANGFLHWYLNTDTDVWPEDEYLFGLRGDVPVVGDWDGDGRDELGVVRPGANGLLHWSFNSDRDPDPESTLDYGLVGDQPVVGNWRMPEITLAGGNLLDQELQFGTTRPNLPMPSRSFQIVNDGNVPLLIGHGQLPAPFQWVGAFPTQVAPGQSVTVTVAMGTSSRGGFAGDLTFTTNDGNESLVRIPLRGSVAVMANNVGQSPPAIPTTPDAPADSGTPWDPISEPEIDIAGVSYGETSPILLGRTNVNGALSRTFTIRNIGSGPLALMGPPGMPSGFSLNWQVPSELAPGASAQFTVRVDTRLAGIKTGQFTIYNNDRNERAFTISVRAVVEIASPEFIGVALDPVTPPQPDSPGGDAGTTPTSGDAPPTSIYGTVIQFQFVRSSLGTIVIKRVITAGALGNNEHLFADFYGTTGGLIVADQIVGNQTLFGLQRQFSVQVLGDGSYAITWTLQKLSGSDIHLAVMDPYGRTLRTNRVNITLGVQLDSPLVVATSSGFTIRWRNASAGNFWQRTFTFQGVATSGETLVP